MTAPFTGPVRTPLTGSFYAQILNKVTMSISVTVRPSGNGRFIAYLGDRPLCKATSTPFFTAARVLLSEGASPDTVLIMRHEGSSIVSMRSTVGEAARLTIVEEDKKGLRVRKYRPPAFEQAQEGGVSGGCAANETGPAR